MPDLSTKLHLQMLMDYKNRKSSLMSRFKKAIKIILAKDDIYGLEWGDPDTSPPLQYVREHFLLPYLLADSVVLEIGSGGGRWTRYMLNVKHLFALDYHQELLDEFNLNFKASNITTVKNNGDDFPGIPEKSIDFLFSFGTFVHLDLDIIERYLINMKPLLKENAIVVIQYSDKTKPLGKRNLGFSDNDPDRMRELVISCGYRIFEEDEKTLGHSSIIRFGINS
jgi:SAM-dependent methyltransferase